MRHIKKNKKFFVSSPPFFFSPCTQKKMSSDCMCEFYGVVCDCDIQELKKNNIGLKRKIHEQEVETTQLKAELRSQVSTLTSEISSLKTQFTILHTLIESNVCKHVEKKICKPQFKKRQHLR